MSKTRDEVRFICQRFFPELISTGQTLTELCERLVQQGVAVNVFCGRPVILYRREEIQQKERYQGIKIERLWSTRFSKLSLLGRITNQFTFALAVFFSLLLSKEKCPLIVTTNPPFLPFLCVLATRFKSRKMSLLIFDLYPQTLEALGVLRNGGLIAFCWRQVNRFVFTSVDSIITIGRCMQEKICADLDEQEHKKVELINIWADEQSVYPVKREVNPYRKKWAIEDKFVLLYSGNMGRYHDVETILDAADLLKEYEDIKFIFVGEGQKKARILKLIEQRQMKNCKVYDHVDRENLAYSLSCADLGLVSLSPGHAGGSVPSKAFAMMASGAPLVAIMEEGAEVARVISEFECGKVIRSGDVRAFQEYVLALYHDPDTLRKLSINSLAAFKEGYALTQVVGKYQALIAVLNRSGSVKA